MQLQAAVVFYGLLRLVHSWKWAGVGVALVITNQSILKYGVTLHPEPLMLLGLTIALFFSVFYLQNPNFVCLMWMSLAMSLAIAGKIQAMICLPWLGMVALFGIWKQNRRFLQTLFLWGSGSLLFFVLGLLLLTPYQLLHFSRLVEGLAGEQDFQASHTPLSIFDWLAYLVSDAFVGYAFTLLLLSYFLRLVLRIKSLSNIFSLSLRQQLNQPEKALLFSTTSYLIWGLFYIVVTVDILVERYLLHALPALILLVWLSCYTLFPWLYTRNRIALFGYLLILLAGIQQQIKFSELYFRGRLYTMNKVYLIREFTTTIQQLVPRDAPLLHPVDRFGAVSAVNPTWFTALYFMQPTHQLVQAHNIQYLLLPINYRDAVLQWEGRVAPFPDDHPLVAETVRFWDDLKNTGITGTFQQKQTFPELQLELYERIL